MRHANANPPIRKRKFLQSPRNWPGSTSPLSARRSSALIASPDTTLPQKNVRAKPPSFTVPDSRHRWASPPPGSQKSFPAALRFPGAGEARHRD